MKLRAWREDRLDRKIGGISLAEVRESRFQDLGAYPTMSAEYGAIEMMFRKFPLDANDVFVDVGCGFAADTNAVTLYAADGRTFELPLQGKDAVARRMLEILLPSPH